MISERAAGFIKGCLKDSVPATSVGVYKLSSLNATPNGQEHRLVVILNPNNGTLQQVSDIAQPNFDVTDQVQFPNLGAITGKGAFKIWENWRGRVFDQPEFQQIVQANDRGKLLNSWWRLIATRRRLAVQGASEYFVRHDIVPYLYSPGFSAAGFHDWQPQVEREFGIMWQRSVPDWDRIKLIIGRNTEGETTTRYEEIGERPVVLVQHQEMLDWVRQSFANRFA